MRTPSAFCIACLLLSVAAPLWAGTTVQLSAEKEVSKGPVLLGQIAEITSDENGMSERLSAIRVGTAPLPGYTRKISYNGILVVLRQQGINTDLVTIQPQTDVVVTAECNRIAGTELMERAEELILQALPYSADAIRITATNLPQEVVVDPGELVISMVTQPKEDFIGYTFLGFDLIVDGQTKRRVSLHLKVSVTAEVAVALGQIPRGQMLTADDVTLEIRDLASVNGRPVGSLEEVVGLRAKFGFRPGQLVLEHLLDSPPVISRGNAITIQVVSGCVSVLAPGLAKQDGRVGERIIVRSQATGKELQATVIDEQLVRVVIPSSSALRGGAA